MGRTVRARLRGIPEFLRSGLPLFGPTFSLTPAAVSFPVFSACFVLEEPHVEFRFPSQSEFCHTPFSFVSCDLTDVVARTLREELGLVLPADLLRPVTVTHSLIRVSGTANLGLVSHVSLGRLGVTFDDVAVSHASAEDGWESEELTAVAAEDFEAWAASRMWTPWGRACWDATISACYPDLAA